MARSLLRIHLLKTNISDRDPDTGKRVPRCNPKSAWHEKDVPHLAIVDRQLFEAARKRKAERSIGHPTSHRRPRHILSGLLRCVACRLLETLIPDRRLPTLRGGRRGGSEFEGGSEF